MGKRSSKRGKAGRAVDRPQETDPKYPFSGTKDKSILTLMDRLFHSHTELCSVLRLAGRQLLRAENQNDESLEKIRNVLKRADNVREALTSVNEWPETLENIHKVVVASASEYNRGQVSKEDPVPKSVQKGNRLRGTQSSRVIRFPAS